MTESNVVGEKSYAFALRIVRACVYLRERKKEYVLSKQLLHSGTSIGANVEEAIQAQSRKDFIAKLCIALKEACESDYWLRLLHDANLLTKEQSGSLRKDLAELMRLLTAIIKTSKKKS